MSDLKIDTGGGNVLDCIQVVEDVVMKHGDEIDAMCWQRLKKRLTPDRERVAKAICYVLEGHMQPSAPGKDNGWEIYLPDADAAIDAMGETP